MLTWSSPSALLLIIVNMIPLAGVMYFGWRMEEVMLLFWLESAVIGFYNILKFFMIAGWQAIGISAFFTVHYGGFMAGHLVFIIAFTGDMETSAFPDPAWLLETIGGFWPAILAMWCSHGFSFLSNFVGQREYLHKTTGQQMVEPYVRIVIMHVSILFGGFMVASIGAPLPAMLLLIVLKTGIDLFSHLREHRKAAAARLAAVER